MENNKNKIKNKIKEYLNESGYSRVANVMRGLVPNVQTFAMLTAENPLGVAGSSKDNKISNKELEKKLRALNLGFVKIQGMYGVTEHSYFVPNITKNEALELGLLFLQESIIFGSKLPSKDNYDGMSFQLIYTTKEHFGQVIGERNVFINMDNEDDYYTKVKGRKFQIPFFNDELNNSQFDKNSGIINKNVSVDEGMIHQINETINVLLQENKTPKSRWIHRGFIKNKISEIYNRK